MGFLENQVCSGAVVVYQRLHMVLAFEIDHCFGFGSPGCLSWAFGLYIQAIWVLRPPLDFGVLGLLMLFGPWCRVIGSKTPFWLLALPPWFWRSLALGFWRVGFASLVFGLWTWAFRDSLPLM